MFGTDKRHEVGYALVVAVDHQKRDAVLHRKSGFAGRIGWRNAPDHAKVTGQQGRGHRNIVEKIGAAGLAVSEPVCNWRLR